MALVSVKAPLWNDIIFYKGNILPSLETISGEYNEWKYTFLEAENELNTLRENIDVYEKADDGKWEFYKKVVNPFELIFTQNKYKTFPDSICLLFPLSRSYFKMIEILSLSEFYKSLEKETRVRTAHVCEGPGGFIEAIVDECFKNKKPLYQATAMTLKPNQPNVPGWKRAAKFLQKHKNVKVIYGKDGSGDILKVENQNSFIETCEYKVHLFTSDGGFDFSIDYSSQEKFIYPLLLASVRIGFNILKENGTFVIKFFDTYFEGMRDLVFFLSCFFRSWTLYKPATSRPCNPEQYFIGRGFRGCPVAVLNILKSWCENLEKNMVQSRIFKEGTRTPEFDGQLQEINKSSVNLQLYYLKKVFELIEKPDETLIKQILKEHEVTSYKWCLKFNVPVYPARVHVIEGLRSDRLVSVLR
jgi:23S rRNA U2552 (ribose-2'-O)-methylase RlmE/FtsJ